MEPSGEKGVELVFGRQQKIDVVVSDLYRKYLDGIILAGSALAGLEGISLFMQWTGDFGDLALRAHNSPREDECFFVWAHILAGVPFAAAGEVKHCNLHIAVF